MKKFEIDTKKVKKIVKKMLPYAFGACILTIGGVVVYKKGFKKGEIGALKRLINESKDGISHVLTLKDYPNEVFFIPEPISCKSADELAGCLINAGDNSEEKMVEYFKDFAKFVFNNQ